jgi:hypothetical protein
MTFKRRCENEQPHAAHDYDYHWKKDDLFYLPSYVARHLPDEWDVTYTCKGIEEPTCTLCGELLAEDTLMIGRRAVFCPNDECEKFAQSFWVER